MYCFNKQIFDVKYSIHYIKTSKYSKALLVSTACAQKYQDFLSIQRQFDV